eukprot:m.234963 g.234963  ORF g.234963 m.234963 type:complete len:1084 (-) comp12747_c0_seq1:63-3314(-)
MSEPWTAIVLTCMKREHASFYLDEFKQRQDAGFISTKTRIMIAEDPNARVGSGGATLNALLVVTELLSALAGQTVVHSETLENARILILHLGGAFLCDPCGKAFTTVAATQTNGAHQALACNVDFLLETVDRLRADAPPGVWVCSTEMFLTLPASHLKIDWSKIKSGFVVFSGLTDAAYAANHGVFKIDPATQLVTDIVYKGTQDDLKACVLPTGGLALVTGLLYFTPATAVRLLSLLVVPPLEACTYFGLDNGAESFELQLFLDLLKSVVSKPAEGPAVIDRARRALWLQLSDIDPVGVHCTVIEGLKYRFLEPSFSQHVAQLYLADPAATWDGTTRQWSSYAHMYFDGPSTPGIRVINSIIGPDVKIGLGSTICHSELKSEWVIGNNCFVSGVRANSNDMPTIKLGDGIVLMELAASFGLAATPVVTVVLGLNDVIQPTKTTSPFTGPVGTFCNQPWERFFTYTGIRADELWEPGTPQCAGTAKLYALCTLHGASTLSETQWLQPGAVAADKVPALVHRWRGAWRVSLQTIMAVANPGAELRWRRQLLFAVWQKHCRLALTAPQAATALSLVPIDGSPSQCILPFLNASVKENYKTTLTLLDDIAAGASNPAVTARTLACIADMLSAMAGGQGGLRSGPGRNASFSRAVDLLEQNRIALGVAALAREREHWLSSPEHLIRAARHYEAAAQILIRHAVMSAREFVATSPSPDGVPAVGVWAVAEAAARVDIAGGWSDTPPITYEHGGAVANAAIMIDGERPIGAKARRIPEAHLALVVDKQTIIVESLDQIRNYTQPQAPGALLKAAFCCAEIVSLDDPRSLKDQLLERYGGGFELHTWSNLPTGSGLGTSSILAGAVLAVLWRIAGQQFTPSAVVHAVLHLEQMLTTGGGWQDQVGGIEGGVKIARSAGTLPLRVDTELIPLTAEQLQTFSRHLVLIYTGKTRLARNLLQNVLRNWYARHPDIVANADALTWTAEECATACKSVDLAGIGACLDKYWAQKKLMAPGCEPAFVATLMSILRPHSHGMALAGAGGGGFMYVISKEPDARAAMEALVAARNDLPKDIRFHRVEIDPIGLNERFE